MDAHTEHGERLVSLARAAVGDQLRSLVRFDRDDWEVLYLREDVDRSVGGRGALQEWFVENERLGFDSATAYARYADRDDVEPSFGEYAFTVRVFDDGLVGRVIVDDGGVLFTTDRMNLSNLEEAAVAIRSSLA
jgi:hypothetical protein